MRWILLLALALFALWLMGGGGQSRDSDIYGASAPVASEKDREREALLDCQMSIKGASLNSSAADVPPVRNYGGPGDYYFAWPNGSGLQLQNSFGAMLDASAACFHDGTRVTGLSINGQDVIGG